MPIYAPEREYLVPREAVRSKLTSVALESYLKESVKYKENILCITEF